MAVLGGGGGGMGTGVRPFHNKIFFYIKLFLIIIIITDNVFLSTRKIMLKFCVVHMNMICHIQLLISCISHT